MVPVLLGLAAGTPPVYWRGVRVPASRWITRVPGRVGPDLGLAGLAREASTLCGNLLLNLALCWCCRAYGRKGGHRRESGIGGSAHATSLSVPPKTATKFNDAVNQSLGQTPWPDLSVLGVVPRDVDVLVPTWAAQVGELRKDLGGVERGGGCKARDSNIDASRP